MNIMKFELKTGWKAFLLWSCGIFILIIGGMVKFTGVSGTETGALGSMLLQIPKPVLAMFGMAEANVETFGGFYSVIEFYVLIVVSCYSVQLAYNSVLRESVDKTYEFLFTKPSSRIKILCIKLSCGLIWLTTVCLLNFAFSLLAPVIYNIKSNLSHQMLLFSAAVFLVSLFFFFLTVFISTYINSPEMASRLSYTAVFVSYALSILFDCDTKFEVVRFLTPMKYFRTSELLENSFNFKYAMLIIVMIIILFLISIVKFKKKDLSAK